MFSPLPKPALANSGFVICGLPVEAPPADAVDDEEEDALEEEEDDVEIG